MQPSAMEKKSGRKNRRTFRNAIAADPIGKDRYGRINSILNPRTFVAFTDQGRANYEQIDWSK